MEELAFLLPYCEHTLTHLELLNLVNKCKNSVNRLDITD
jgi:hypothetical protein